MFILAAWQLVYSQMENRFSLGPGIGANFSNANEDGIKNRPGLGAGITSTYSVSERSGIIVDLLYSGEGYKKGNLDIALNCLKIPILYNFFLGQLGEPFRPKIHLRMAPGFLLSANFTNNDVKNQFKSSAVDLVRSWFQLPRCKQDLVKCGFTWLLWSYYSA